MREMLQESIDRILADQVTPTLLQAGETGQWQSSLFKLLDDGGFTRALAPEADGGVGADWSDVFPIVFASGRHALPLPVPESLAACWILSQCAIQSPPGSLVLAEAQAGASLSRAGGDWRFSGHLAQVAWGRRIEHCVTCVTHEATPRIVLLARADALVRTDANTAREPRDRLSFTEAPVIASALWPEDSQTDPVRLYGALVRSAQLAGAMEAVVALCVRYANDRVQFGIPIGKFQAIQQQLAVLASQSASVTAAAEYAFAMAAQGRPGFATACAKQRASEIAGNAAAIAHAVHGAIGFTYEHSLHFLTRRLWAWRSEFGTHAHWAEHIGRLICRGGGAGVWATLTAESVHAD